MALNLTVHDPLRLQNGAMPQTVAIDEATGAASPSGQIVALGAQSAAFAGPCVLRLIPDENQRVQLSRTAGYAAPAASGIRLMANTLDFLEVRKSGTFYLNVAAG